jgi:hypothetical protein
MALIRLFKIIAFIAPITALLQNSRQRTVKTRLSRLYLDDEQWDSGEVSWETIPFTQYSPIGINKKSQETQVASSGEYKMNPCTTPLCKKIKDDQTQLASVSAVAKISYKELFNLDLFISEFNYNIHTHNLFNPSEMVFLTLLSGVAYVYNKTKETEINRIQRLYKFSSRSEYFEKYKEIRKFTMMFFIITTCIFTRSVQIAE